MKEHAILSDRIYYEDETPPRPQIKPHKIFEDYDPDVTGRIATPSDRKLRYSTSSTISYSDSDWEERATDDELFVV